jgi:hypothetical protein
LKKYPMIFFRRVVFYPKKDILHLYTAYFKYKDLLQFFLWKS